MTDLQIEILWEQLGETPITDTECIAENFYIWKKRTNRIEIWYWFNEVYNEGVCELMFLQKMIIA